MTAQQILKMIEEVSPDDTAKLDEIDKRSAEYLLFKTPDKSSWLCPAPQFTRSRDALKEIRPEGWKLYIDENPEFGDGWVCVLEHAQKETIYSAELSTEELAELHAIIQAIEYERAKQ